VNGSLEDARITEDHPSCAELALAVILSAASLARRFTEDFLRKQDLDEIADAACLITSELVTNAIKAAGTAEAPAGARNPDGMSLPRIVVRLRVPVPVLRIEVWDDDPRPPVPVLAGVLDESGRGLMLVAAMASAWGHTPSPGGKAVWAEIPIPAEATCSALS
jgi:hypothetical protein